MVPERMTGDDGAEGTAPMKKVIGPVPRPK